MDDQNASTLKQTIRQSMQEKDTAELLEIWQKQDRTIWTATALEVVGEILSERLDVLPDEPGKNEPAEIADTFFNLDRAVAITEWATWISNLGFVIAGILLIGYTFTSLQNEGSTFSQFLFHLVNGLAQVLLLIAVSLLLQGMAHIIYLLLDIEKRTRHAGQTL